MLILSFLLVREDSASSSSLHHRGAWKGKRLKDIGSEPFEKHGLARGAGQPTRGYGGGVARTRNKNCCEASYSSLRGVQLSIHDTVKWRCWRVINKLKLLPSSKLSELPNDKALKKIIQSIENNEDFWMVLEGLDKPNRHQNQHHKRKTSDNGFTESLFESLAVTDTVPWDESD